MYYSLVGARGDPVHNDIEQVVVSHLGRDIESINIVKVFVDSPCLPKMTELIENPVWFVVVPIIFPDSVLNFFQSSIPVPVSFPPFQCFPFYV